MAIRRERRGGIAQALILLAFALPVAICLVWIAGAVFAGLLVGTLASVSVLLEFAHRRRLADLAVGRPGESICTFARSFGRRAVCRCHQDGLVQGRRC